MVNPYLEVDQKIVSEIYSKSEPMDNLISLCDVYGSRWPGTPGDLGSVKFMVDKLKSYGIDNARYESFNFVAWERGEALLEITSPMERELECISLPKSLGDEVEGKIVFLGDGPIEIYEEKKDEIDGNIVMVTSATPLGMNRSLHRSEKFMRSVLAGAKGWIFMNHYPGYGPPTGTVAPIIPAVGVSYEVGSFLKRRLEEGEVRVKISSTGRNVEVETYNVICDVGGESPDGEYVLTGSHYDGHDISQGALDPASGAVTVMEMARVLNLVKDKLKRRIRFLCFGAEEIGLYGSYKYVLHHRDEMDKMRFMLNLDSAGGEGRKGVIFNGHPELEPLIKEMEKEIKTELPTGQNVSPYGDLWPYFVEGIPGGGGGDPEARRRRTGRGFGHTRYDTVDKIKLENLRLAAANYSRFLFRVANMDEWPAKRKNQKEIDDFIKDQGYEETVKLTNKVKDYISTWDVLHPETQVWLKERPTEDLYAAYVPYETE
jgi:Zn-dependent M28 family amino/carboxypeptidase